MKMLLVLAVAATVAFGDQLQRKAEPFSRIIDGKRSICIRNAEGHHVAGGSILTRRWVVTAVHNILKYNSSELKVVVGILKLSDKGIKNEQSLDVVRIINHPKFSSVTYFNDICLLKLSFSLVYAKNVLPISLQLRNSRRNDSGIISGWRERNGTDTTYPDILQYAEVDILSNSECKNVIAAVGKDQLKFYNSTLNLCSVAPQEREKNAICYGDVGIISWAVRTCGSPGNPSIYTNVAAYTTWILKNIKS